MPQLLGEEGIDTTLINPNALRDAKLTLPLDYREKILEAAIASRTRA